jgi:hypothetical protein
LFENILLSRILSEVSGRGLLRDEQFGFRPKHSTSLQLAQLVERVSRNFDETRLTGAVLFDVAKAFDTVWVDGLLFKLTALNVPSHLVKSISSYLHNLLSHFGLLVDCRNNRLLDGTTCLSAPDNSTPTSIPSVKTIGSSVPLNDSLAEFPQLTGPTGIHREVRHNTVHHIRTIPGSSVTSRPRSLALAKAEFNAAPKGPGLQNSTWSPRNTTVGDLAGITEP